MEQLQTVAPPATTDPPAVNWSQLTASYCHMRRYFKLPIHYTGLALYFRHISGKPIAECIRLAQFYCAAWLKLDEMNARARRRMGVTR